jgi:uncharacterized cysteine cluster protein YcgN (CxxCxxCC family)
MRKNPEPARGRVPDRGAGLNREETGCSKGLVCRFKSSLLEMHIEALFTLNLQSKLVAINEPWDKTRAAPRLYLGKTFDGSMIYKFRYDVPLEIIKKLEEYLSEEISSGKNDEIKYTNEYLKLLESENCFEEICYSYSDKIKQTKNNCVKITIENIKDFELKGFDWLNDEIIYSQPCYGIIEKGKMVSVCRSVRITEKAHEAGIETKEEHRGKGLAIIALKEWARDIQNNGYIPLYSTSKENRSSQRVAEKTLLNKFGIGISIN